MHVLRRSSFVLPTLALVSGALVAASMPSAASSSAAPSAAPSAATVSVESSAANLPPQCAATNVSSVDCFWFGPGTGTWTPPPGVTQAQFVARGGGGASGNDAPVGSSGPGGLGGDGARVTASLIVVPGHTYHLTLGGGGSFGTGGFNGGGAADSLSGGAGAGGGASEVRTGTGPASRILVAGGGGGGGGGGTGCANMNGIVCAGGKHDVAPAGGFGGTNAAGTAGNGGCGQLVPQPDGAGGSLATAHAGGRGGVGGPGSDTVTAGSPGGNGTSTDGGAGGASDGLTGGGGGGGGGFGGGGGGGSGSSFVSPDGEYCFGAGGGGAAGVSYVAPSLIVPGTTPTIGDSLRGPGDFGSLEISFTMLVVSPANAVAGQPLTIAGGGFTPGESVRVVLGSIPLAAPAAGADGTFHTVAFAPATTRGAHQIVATGRSSGTQRTGGVTMLPSVTAQPASQRPTSAADAGLFGFAPSISVILYWDTNGGTELGHGQTDALGSLTIPFVVPASASIGTHHLVAATAAGAVQRVFTVTSALTPPPGVPPPGTALVYPTTASPGQTVYVAANGLVAGRTVQVTAGNGNGPLARPTVLPTGLCDATIVLPPAPLGPLTVHIGAKTVTLTVRPRVVAIPAAAAPGGSMTAAVFGFPAADSVSLRWDTASGGVLVTLVTDARGSGTSSITVPSTATAGPTHLFATDSAGHTAFVAVKVT